MGEQSPETCRDWYFFLWRCDPTWVMASSLLRFLDHTQRRTTAGRTPLDEWSARRRDLYLTTHNTHRRQTSMLPVGFEPTISADERPQTYDLERAATGTGWLINILRITYKQNWLYLQGVGEIFALRLSWGSNSCNTKGGYKGHGLLSKGTTEVRST
jgi:hypothetical protein